MELLCLLQLALLLKCSAKVIERANCLVVARAKHALLDLQRIPVTLLCLLQLALLLQGIAKVGETAGCDRMIWSQHMLPDG